MKGVYQEQIESQRMYSVSAALGITESFRCLVKAGAYGASQVNSVYGPLIYEVQSGHSLAIFLCGASDSESIRYEWSSLQMQINMPHFWVVDTKCKVLPESVIPQDGSQFYYGRSVVPASSREAAVEQLIIALKESGILVDTVLVTVPYQEGEWSDDDDFEVHLSFEEASITNTIELGCFVSEKSFPRS